MHNYLMFEMEKKSVIIGGVSVRSTVTFNGLSLINEPFHVTL